MPSEFGSVAQLLGPKIGNWRERRDCLKPQKATEGQKHQSFSLLLKFETPERIGEELELPSARDKLLGISPQAPRVETGLRLPLGQDQASCMASSRQPRSGRERPLGAPAAQPSPTSGSSSGPYLPEVPPGAILHGQKGHPVHREIQLFRQLLGLHHVRMVQAEGERGRRGGGFRGLSDGPRESPFHQPGRKAGSRPEDWLGKSSGRAAWASG